jgi:SAM-dependent methyltransferase
LAADPEYLKGQYATSSNLNARRSIYRFGVRPLDLHARCLALVDWPRVTRVLDAGCGDGAYLARLPGTPAIGLDMSVGMLAEAARSAPVVVGDVQSLPFPEDSFDAVLAMHMLYHVSDIPLAIRELRRVLSGGGVMLALTNSDRHLAEMWSAWETVTGVARPVSVNRFKVENAGEYLAGVFERVELEEFRGLLRVTESQPVLDYLASVRHNPDRALPAGITWDVLKEGVREIVEDRIASSGAFEISTSAGVFVCRGGMGK